MAVSHDTPLATKVTIAVLLNAVAGKEDVFGSNTRIVAQAFDCNQVVVSYTTGRRPVA